MNSSASPVAWLVIAADGYRAVFLDHAAADRYALRVHGTVHPLYTLDRKEDAPC